jgi:hypothetical protein
VVLELGGHPTRDHSRRAMTSARIRSTRCFGLMHSADQFAALAERSARVNPDGVLLLQYHSLTVIIRCGRWSARRHGTTRITPPPPWPA